MHPNCYPRDPTLLTLEPDLFVSKVDAMWNTSALRGIVDSNNFNREIVEIPRINVMDTIEKKLSKAILDHPLLVQLNKDLIETITQLQTLRNRNAGYTIPATAGEFAQKPPAQANEEALLGYGTAQPSQGLVHGRSQGQSIYKPIVTRSGFRTDSEDEDAMERVVGSITGLTQSILEISAVEKDTSDSSPDESPAEVPGAQVSEIGESQRVSNSLKGAESIEELTPAEFLLNAMDMYDSDISVISDMEGFTPITASERKDSVDKPVAAKRNSGVAAVYHDSVESTHGKSTENSASKPRQTEVLDLNDYESDDLIRLTDLSVQKANFSKVMDSPDPPLGRSSGTKGPPEYFEMAEDYRDSDDSDFEVPASVKGG